MTRNVKQLAGISAPDRVSYSNNTAQFTIVCDMQDVDRVAALEIGAVVS